MCCGHDMTDFFGGSPASRLLYASAKDGLLPSSLGVLSPTRGTPDRAILFQTGMTCVFVVFGGGFRSLVSFFSVANWTFFFSTVSVDRVVQGRSQLRV